VLKENELKKYGEYRTQRLVLAYYRAWADGEMRLFEGMGAPGQAVATTRTQAPPREQIVLRATGTAGT
jgi:hypothetical protein